LSSFPVCTLFGRLFDGFHDMFNRDFRDIYLFDVAFFSLHGLSYFFSVFSSDVTFLFGRQKLTYLTYKPLDLSMGRF